MCFNYNAFGIPLHFFQAYKMQNHYWEMARQVSSDSAAWVKLEKKLYMRPNAL